MTEHTICPGLSATIGCDPGTGARPRSYFHHKSALAAWAPAEELAGRCALRRPPAALPDTDRSATSAAGPAAPLLRRRAAGRVLSCGLRGASRRRLVCTAATASPA